MSDEISLDKSSVEFEQQLRQLRPTMIAIDEQAIWFQAGRQSALHETASSPKPNLRLGQLAWCSAASALAGALLVAFIGSIWSQSNARSMDSFVRGDLSRAPRFNPTESELKSKELAASRAGQSETAPIEFVDPASQATNRLLDALFNNNDLQLRTIRDWQDVMNGRRTIASLVTSPSASTNATDIDQDFRATNIGSLNKKYFSLTQ